MTTKNEYTVLIHAATEGGYWAEIPALPGCFSQGESMEDVIRNIHEAVAVHVEALREEGRAPSEDPVVGTIKVAI